MFIDQEWKKDFKSQKNSNNDQLTETSSRKPIFLMVVGLLVTILIAGGLFLYFGRMNKNPGATGNTVSMNNQSNEPGVLPSDHNSNDDQFRNSSTTNIQAQNLAFGSFYKKPENNFTPSFKDYSLPINIKKDVTNYFEVSRKINLDPYIDNLNNKGFAIIDNQSSTEANEFFSAYRYLLSKDLPVVLTTDFLYYYYHNALKRSYSDIQQTTFFDNLWDVNKKMYTISLTRYRNRLEKVGQSNDPILEAERLETAYFAVALHLLAPTNEQIDKHSELVDNNKFSEQQASNYNLDLPEFLKTDVLKEVDLIRAGSETLKSPVMSYQKDYKYFKVPVNYKENAKLNNFYLSLKWLNTEFPLYYRSIDCEECILDKDDWLINMTAANFIAKDLSESQEIENEWAIIYKFISFFSGLRQDLTYLNYVESMEKLFGEGYEIESIFSPDNKKSDEDLKKIQEQIASYRFSSMEGEIIRDLPSARKYIGMRLLQEDYWPNDYIFRKMTGEDMLSNFNNKLPEYTSCNSTKAYTKYRCRAIGLDIVNLLRPQNSFLNSEYFIDNTNYQNYDEKKNALIEEMEHFNVNTWNNNVYWVTLGINRLLLSYDRNSLPVFMHDNDWFNKKDVNTALGAWVNLHLPEDKLVPYSEKAGTSLGQLNKDDANNYIEPNAELIRELIAKNKMLVDMLNALNVTKKSGLASDELNKLDSQLKQILKIIEKELSDQPLDEDDYGVINDLIKVYSVLEKRSKVYETNVNKFKNYESIDNIKFVAFVYNKGDKKILAFGPIFNYQEK